MSKVLLSEIISAAGQRAGSRTAPVYSVTKHAGFIRSDEYFKKQVFSKDLSTYKLVQPGDFAYATIHLDEGSIGIAPESALISPMYTVFAVDRSRVDPDYLLRYLKSDHALQRYPLLSRGAVHRRMAISLKALGTLEIDLPPLPEQRRIAAILDQADELACKQQQVLAELDRVLTASFDRFFGSSDAPLKRLSEFVMKIESGVSPSCEARPAEPDETGVLKLGAVTYGVFKEQETKAYLGDISTLRGREVRSGDVLMTRKNTPELVGAVALVPDVRRALFFPDLVFRLTLDEIQIRPAYFWARMMLTETRNEVRAIAGGSAKSMSNISQSRLRDLSMPVPSLEEQDRFSNLLESVRTAQDLGRQRLSELQDLRNTLANCAFRGDL